MITKQQIYALLAIKYLASMGFGAFTSRKEIAEAEGIPTHFLAKILQDLRKRGLADIRQGAGGGPCLIKEASEISVLEVLEICGGPLRFDRGVGGRIGEELQRAQALVESYLDSVKISDLVNGDD